LVDTTHFMQACIEQELKEGWLDLVIAQNYDRYVYAVLGRYLHYLRNRITGAYDVLEVNEYVE